MTRIKRTRLHLIFLTAAILSVIMISAPRGYSDTQISPLNAAQLGLARLETMISTHKADAGWAANLSAVKVSLRNIKGFAEYVVHISRSTGDPASVDFYFAMNGTATGSSGSLEKHRSQWGND